jgi:hypothetical protein
MDKRWAVRRPLKINVDLRYRDMEVMNCQTRDVSLNGAFVELEQLQPAVDTAVDLVFRLGGTGQYTKYKVPSKVARATGEGIGVMFDEMDISSFRTLRQVLNAN